MAQQQGAMANQTGKFFEQEVAGMLRRHGFHELDATEKQLLARTCELNRYSYPRWFVQQIGMERNVYGAKHKSDFFLVDKHSYPEGLHIEVKHQASGGSVDEKYVFAAYSMVAFSGKSAMIIEGGGARECAIRWVREFAAKSKGKFSYMNFNDFRAWARREFS